ncbi:PepSY-associated TM helix domain-containing protein [Chitinophaga cymbidii]|uniref:Sulfite reductase n=1 Tax=Chitinophaga cymbidii TaxID=1096750 RepID=A0A512RED4_9BACT|nr:PepSY-associated TM helix domain-containing protein [Chitinophaga cymbidii]GEP94065.1 sulfite reductase [Chitinophaga cymbidii]
MATKKRGKSVFRRLNDWLHLWLGLISGIVVVIISLTGCIYAFQREFSDLTQPYQHVKTEAKPYMLPSELKAIATEAAFGPKGDTGANRITGISYRKADRSTIASFMDKENGYTSIYLNPYTGEVLKVKALKHDFFRFILEGHFNLWLPRPIGQPIVAISTLIFVILLITGLVMWWPKKWNKTNRQKSFAIKWGAGKKRINYDLHNVLGFYSMVFALVLGLTGLVWGFQWFSKSLYWTLSGGKTLAKFERPVSDTTLARPAVLLTQEDRLYARMRKEYPVVTGSLTLQFPTLPKDAYSVVHNPHDDAYYRRQFRFFDQVSLAEIKGGGLYGQKYDEISTGEKIYRMNYDIHVGAIAGLPGKILAFFISLICASLPVTGFIVWWGKKKKKSRKKPEAKPERKIAARVAASL